MSGDSDSNDNEQHEKEEKEEKNSLTIFGSNKISMILLLLFVIFIYIIMFSVLHKNNENPSGWILVIEIILWVTLIVIIFVNIKWMNDKDFNIKAEINDLFNDKMTEINIFAIDNKHPKRHIHDISHNYADISHNHDVSQNKIRPANSECQKEDGEVFHVGTNTYTYDDAKEVCSLLNSRLATYHEVEAAYQNGANWCNYGWSDEQLALFPIQKELYNQLKTIPGHQHDCGRPGVNGGYIEDNQTTFGVNCYGKKPFMTEKDANFMKNYTYTPTMSPEEQAKLDSKINKILIAPFTKDKWSFQ
jgi:hypothetical protein